MKNFIILGILLIIVIVPIVFAIWYIKNLKNSNIKKIKLANIFMFLTMYSIVFLYIFDISEDLTLLVQLFLWPIVTLILLVLTIIFYYLIFRYFYIDKNITPIKIVYVISMFVFIYFTASYIKILNFPEQNTIYKLSSPIYITLITIIVFFNTVVYQKSKFK